MKQLNFDQLKHMHEAELDLSRQFIAILEAERQAVIDKNFEQLNTIIIDKSRLIEKLQISADKRDQCLTLSAAKKSKTWSAFIDHLGILPLQQQWQTIKENLLLCQKENTINGRLINRSHQIYSDLLRLIKGNPNTANTYTANGGKSSTTLSQTVAKA